MNAVYIETLDMEKLQGRKDCEIFYVKHRGNFEQIMKDACKRNIRLTSISEKEYIEKIDEIWVDIFKNYPTA